MLWQRFFTLFTPAWKIFSNGSVWSSMANVPKANYGTPVCWKTCFARQNPDPLLYPRICECNCEDIWISGIFSAMPIPFNSIGTKCQSLCWSWRVFISNSNRNWNPFSNCKSLSSCMSNQFYFARESHSVSEGQTPIKIYKIARCRNRLFDQFPTNFS